MTTLRAAAILGTAIIIGASAVPGQAQPNCASTAGPAFAGFDTLLMPVLAKRICGADSAADAQSIAAYLAARGCGAKSGVALAVDEMLSHPAPEDFIAEFGAYAWYAVPDDKKQRFCETASAIDLGTALTTDPGNPDPAVERAFTAFFDAAFALRED